MSEPEELTAEEYTALERALEEAEKRAAFVAKPLADQTNAPQFGGGGGAVGAALPLGLGTSVPHPFKPTSAVATTDERARALSDSGRAACSVSGAAVGGAAGSVGSPTAPPAKRPNTAQQVPHYWSSLGSGVAGGRPHASLTSAGSHMQTAVQPPTVSGWGGNHAAGVHSSPWPHPQQQHHIQQLPSHPYQHQHQHQQGRVQGAHPPSGGNLYPSLHAAAYHYQQPQPACAVLAGSAAAGPRPDTSPPQAPSLGAAAVAAAAAASGMQPFLGAAAAGSVATERLQPLGMAVSAASVPAPAWPGWPSGSGSSTGAHAHVPTPQQSNQQQRISMGAPVCAPVASSCAAQSQHPCQHNQTQQPHKGPRSHHPQPQTAPHRVVIASTASRGSGAPPLPATSPQAALLLVPPPPAAALAWVSRPPGVAQLQAASGAATAGGGAFVPAVEPAAPDRRPPSSGLQQQPQQPGPLQPVAQSGPGPEPGPLGKPHPHRAASLLTSAQGSGGCCMGPSFVVAATPLPPPLPSCGTVVAPHVPEAALAAPPPPEPAACSAAVGTWRPQLPRSLHRPPLQATGVLDGAAGVGACAGGSSSSSSTSPRTSAMISRGGEAGRGGAGGSTAGCSATVALGIAPAALCEEAAAVAAPAIAANGSTADNCVNGAKPTSSRRLPASFMAATASLPVAASSLLGSAKDSAMSGGSSTTACVAGAQSSNSGGNVSISRAGSSRAAAAALPSIAEVRAAKAAAAAAASGGTAAGGAVSKPRLPVLPYQGAIRYATTALEVEWLVGQLAAAAPAVVGLDMEWRPQYVTGVPANPVALLQICYAVAPAAAAALQQPVPAATAAAAALPAVPALPAAAVPQSSAAATATAADGNGAAGEQRVPAGSEATAAAASGAAAGAVGAGGGAAGSSAAAAAMGQSGVQEQRALHPSFEGRHCVCLLLHVLHSGIPPRLRHLLEAEQPVKVGVNISGDASKLRRDCGVEMRGLLELDEVANDRVLQVIENVTVNTEYRSRWSLSALVETALRCHLPKPNNIRCGNWERKPLDGAQRRYAALDAYAGLAVWASLVRLPRRHIIAAAPSAVARQLPAAPPPAAAAAGAAVVAAHVTAAEESAAAARGPASAATVAVAAAAVGTAAAASVASSDV